MKTQNYQISSPKQHRNHGFTLVEMLLVVTIIGILAGLVIPRMVGVTDGARFKAVRADIDGGLKTALDRYEMDIGRFPPSLQALLMQPPDAAHWTGPYLDKQPLDPWGHAYIYYYPGKHRPDDYDLLSAGPDGKEGTDDDIGNWEQGS